MPHLRFFKAVILCLALGLACLAQTQEAEKVLVEYFYQPGCRECELVKNLVLPRADESFGGRYELRRFDIGGKENFLKLATYQESLGIKGNEPVTMIVEGIIALSGYKAINEGLNPAICDQLAILDASKKPVAQSPGESSDAILKKRAERMTLAAVMLAGIIDCFNPCAFSTLVLFMSILAVSKIGGRKLLAVGAVYCLAAFLTYTLLGFGLFHCIKALSAFHSIQVAFNMGMVALLAILAAMSFRDAWKYSKGGRPEDISIQLPGRLKTLIHSTMRSSLKFHHLLFGAAMVGVLVTLIESVCTGQVYIPTLTLLAKESAETFKWVSLILLYNAMFTIPLVLLFIAAYLGTGTPRLLEWSKRNVIPSKILMGLLFLALATMIILL